MSSSRHSKRTAETETEDLTNLAAAYRLAALAGWGDTIYSHLSATVLGEKGYYLINKFGLSFDEVTVSNLVATDARKLAKGISEGVANAILIKPNPVGTLSGTLQAIELACLKNKLKAPDHG